MKSIYKIGDKELQACVNCEGIEEMEFKGYDITKVPIKETWECKNCNKINKLYIKK